MSGRVDGGSLCLAASNRSFSTPLGDVFVNENGDKDVEYVVRTLDEDSNKFKVISKK